MKFLGYERPDSSAGIRNHVLVIPGWLLGAKIYEFVEGTTTILTAVAARPVGIGRQLPVG